MIWYLLYPLRGTTEPPKLSQTHPLRLAFQRHGIATASHWLLSILLTVAIAVLLCYPVLFLNTSTIPGPHSIPHHAWTSTTEILGGPRTHADVEMRQVWMHGDYMKALDPRVLRQALHVQEALIGGGFGADDDSIPNDKALGRSNSTPCAPSSRSASWAFHSPLMLWNCSSAVLDVDTDIIATINNRSNEQSYLNFTLRPSSIFAGKSFKDGKVQAADALVITLFDFTKFGIREDWETRLKTLGDGLSDQWSLYPENGVVTASQLYEFRFRPMTVSDDIFLALAYGIMAFYVLLSLGKMRAVTSRFGLAIAVVCKMSAAILASFTICGMLKINLAHIPREAYPFVVLVIGLDNIFRLINEVLSNPPQIPTAQRIGKALGEVGHLSLAQTFQNLALLWLLSRVVSPGVAAFCAFAAVALVFDFVFHLTFFLAVLAVDVRRLELQDSLDRANLSQPAKITKHEQKPWIGAFLARKVPVQTRLAGSAALVSFVLMLNWHFFDTDSPRPLSFGEIIQNAFATKYAVNASRSSRAARLRAPINQACTPAEWLRMQDHDTAKEFIRFIKPNAYSIVARVYDPVLVLLNGADGRDARAPDLSFLAIIRQLAEQHFFPVALAAVFTIAGVTLLTNYLLSNELLVNTDDDGGEASLVVDALPMSSHGLDIIRLSSSGRGHVVSISLDRATCLWSRNRISMRYYKTVLYTARPPLSLWPIVATAIEDNGNNAALLSNTGQTVLWTFEHQQIFKFLALPLKGQTPLLFSFAPVTTISHSKSGKDGSVASSSSSALQNRSALLVVTPDGGLIEADYQDSPHHSSYQICPISIIAASLLYCAKDRTNIITATRTGEVHITTKMAYVGWTTEALGNFGPRLTDAGKLSKIRSIIPVSSLGLVLIVRQYDVDVLDFQSRTILYTLRTNHIKANTLRVLHSHRNSCSCGATTINSLSIVYSQNDGQALIMHTFTIDDSPSSQICLRPSSETDTRACQGLETAQESIHTVQKPGVWEATHGDSIIGVRKRSLSPPLAPTSAASGTETCDPEAHSGTLKHRTGQPHPCLKEISSSRPPAAIAEPDTDAHDSEQWEAWVLSSSGEFRSTPLTTDAGDAQLSQTEQLWVASAGPIVRHGKRGVAVGFGNVVKIISLGKEGFEEDSEEFVDPTVLTWRSGRRGVGRKGL